MVVYWKNVLMALYITKVLLPFQTKSQTKRQQFLAFIDHLVPELKLIDPQLQTTGMTHRPINKNLKRSQINLILTVATLTGTILEADTVRVRVTD